MAQSTQVKNSFTFVKGLISEASPLTFPEDASLDENNFELLRDGSRKKRLGIDYEEDYSYSALIASSSFEDRVTTTYVWKSVDEDGSKSFLVTQIDDTLYFHDLSSSSNSISNSIKSFTVSLTSFKTPTSINVGNTRVSMSSGKGFLFVNSKEIEPLYVKYDPDTDTIEAIDYNINIRDFDGLDSLESNSSSNILETDERPDLLSDTHNYNLRNQGWNQELHLRRTGATTGIDFQLFKDWGLDNVYPSNADIAHFGVRIDPSDNSGPIRFFPEDLEHKYFKATPAPKGHFVLDIFTKQRSISGIPGLPLVDVVTSRPSSSAFFAGRLFTAVGSNVYFSQLIKSEKEIGRCYQEADPTAEQINEIVATDGGVIPIPDSGDILKVVALSYGLVVFSTNGVWFINGADSAFTATNFQNNFISNVGIQDGFSVLSVEDAIYYHNDSGIYTIGSDQVSGLPKVTNISQTTIHSVFLAISASARSNMFSIYDPLDKKIYWLYNTDPSYDGSSFRSRYDGILVLDLVLDAFYKLSIEELTSTAPSFGSPFIYSAFITPELQTVSTEVSVVDSLGVQIVDSLGQEVVVAGSEDRPIITSLMFLVAREVPGFTANQYTFASLTNTNLVDWEKEDTIGIGYTAFLTTGYAIEDDIMRFKQAPYIQCAFNRTESRFVDNGSGGVEFDRPSSCLMKTHWDWSDNTVSGKVTSEQEVYRYRRPFISGAIGEVFDNGLPVVTTKTKIRGRGRAVNLTFTSPANTDCQLLGWAILGLGNTLP
jgi:hypothetical protein